MNAPFHINIFGHGQPLVLLHGWGWDSTIWKPLIPKLSSSFQLFLVDLPGFGKSHPLINSYTCEAIVLELFQRVPVQSTWLGWSLGGMIAWWAATHYPERVNRLITVCSSPKFTSTANWPGVSPCTLEKFKESLLNNTEKTLQEFLELQLRGSSSPPALDIEKIQFTQEGLYGGLHLLETLDLRASLSKVKIPSLHIFGSNDTLVPKSVVKLIEPEIKNGKCEIIQRAGHIPFLTHMDLFCELIQFFF